MEGQRISHYKVLEKIGEGGMGQVYLAEDTSLDRKVALKFLPEHLHSDDVAHKRFIREAKSAAALDHPFICHIHEVGEVDGKNFISMEYVEGETLRDRLAREPLTYREVLRMGSEIAEALQRAHEAGIVHRDLKPSNIMLTKEGRVKVMDFGLAKRVVVQDVGEQETTAALTKEGTTLGTVPYMSPEQLRGEEVDARSDIFSFGILLYEMLVGKHPFQRNTPTQTAAAILEAKPEFPSGSPAGPGGTLNELLPGMLTKNRQGRTQSVEQVRETLEALLEQVTLSPTPRWLLWVAGLALAVLVSFGAYHLYEFVTAPSETIDSLAILPFAPQGNAPELERLCFGIPDTLISKLSRALPAVKVSSASSSLRFAPDADLREVAEKLDVRAVVLGRLVASASDFLVSVEMVDTLDNRHLWGDQYPLQLVDIHATQQSVARRVCEALRVQLTSEEESRLTKEYTQNTEAQLAYLNGRLQLLKWQNFEEARGYFREAIQADPGFAPAYVELAHAYALGIGVGEPGSPERREEMKAAAKKAMELDPYLAGAHWADARVRFFDGDWIGAERGLSRAIELEPGFALAHSTLGGYFARMGRLDEAIAASRVGVKLDPLDRERNLSMGRTYYLDRQYDQAIRYFTISLESSPSFWPSHYMMGCTYWKKQMLVEAARHFEQASCPGCGPAGATGWPWVMAMLGKKEQALQALEAGPAAAFNGALTHAVLGEVELAFSCLEKAVRQPRGHIQFLKVDPIWDALRGDPRFTEMIRKAGLEP